LPDANNVVGVAGVQGLTVRGPGQRCALWHEALLWLGDLGLELIDNDLVLQVPNLDRVAGGSAEPVAVWREAQRIDDVTALERVQVLVVVQVPQHGVAVLAARSAERTVWRNGDRVEVAVVAVVVGLELAVSQVPHLHGAVPTSRDDDRVGHVWREAHARHPIGVSILSDGVLALAKSVPQLDGAVTRARHDLTVVGREGNAQDVLLVVIELSGGLALGQIPQAKSAVPGARQAKLTVRGDNGIRNKVTVTLKSLIGNTARRVVLVKLPDNQSLVSRSGQNNVWKVVIGGDLSDPAVVALEGAFQRQLFVRHFSTMHVFSLTI